MNVLADLTSAVALIGSASIANTRVRKPLVADHSVRRQAYYGSSAKSFAEKVLRVAGTSVPWTKLTLGYSAQFSAGSSGTINVGAKNCRNYGDE